MENKLRENPTCTFFFEKCYIFIKFGSECIKSLAIAFHTSEISSLTVFLICCCKRVLVPSYILFKEC